MSIQTLEKKRRDAAGDLITSGKISSAVWFVAWPTIVVTLFHTAYNIINRFFLGHVPGDTSVMLAALGIGQVALMVQQGIMFGVCTGASALSSRFLGAEDVQNAQEAVGQSLALSTIIAIVTGVPLAIFAHKISIICGARPNVAPYAADYLWIIALYGSVPMFLRMTIQTALRSAGDAKSPLYTGIVLIFLNVLFDWLLIWGPGPFPSLGVKGAGIATVIAHASAFLVIMGFLKKSILAGCVFHLKPHPVWYSRIMKIGWPAMLQNLIWSTGFGAYIKILGILPNATEAQAALTVALPIEMVAFMPGNAYAIAATPLVGQNLGAGKPKRAEHCAWVATWQAVAFMSCVAVLFLAIPRQLAAIFTNSEPVIHHVVTYLRINGAVEPFLASAMVLTGALQGAGDTIYPMLIELAASWIARLPLAWFLAVYLGYGVTGAWIAMAFSTFLYGTIVAIWFRMGRWKSRQV